jgi:MFS transporter, DHA1 family, inner membrane transport protein
MTAKTRHGAALLVLALGAFAIGTAEFIVVGVLDLVADDLRVSVSRAGYFVTAYALGITFGGPIATALTAQLGRRRLLLLAMALFIACNLVTQLSSAMSVLLFTRFIGGTLHGLYVGVASVIAAQLVPPEQRGSGIAMVFGGIAVATVLGVPLGALIAQAAGWRMAFAALAAIGTITLLAMYLAVPRTTAADSSAAFARQARAALAPPVLLMLGLGLLLLGGQFTAFTYLVPFLQKVTGISGEPISAFLLIYGAASAVGVFIGGRMADRDPSRTLLLCSLALLPTLGALYVFGTHPVVVAIALGAWGLAGFGLVPALQLRVISLARCGRDLAATLSASAVNAGIAAGSLLGGWSLARYGVTSIVLLAIVVCALAVPVVIATRRLEPHPSDGHLHTLRGHGNRRAIGLVSRRRR